MHKHIQAGICILALVIFFAPEGAEGGWTIKSPMPTPRHGLCSAVLDGKIYVIGGRGASDEILAVVERYDPEHDIWETGIDLLQEPRCYAAAVSLNGKIYVIGGRGGQDQLLKTVEMYDPLQNQWSYVQNLHQRREALAAAVLEGKIYAIGGFRTQYLNSVEKYDPVLNTWEKETLKLGKPRASLQAVTVKDTLYAIGGMFFAPMGIIERFDPQQGWMPRGALKVPRGNFAAAVVGDTVYIIGGMGQAGLLKSMEAFLPTSLEWRVKDPLNIPREGLTAAAVGSKIYAIGGRRTHHPQVLDVVEEYAVTTPVIDQKQPPPPSNFQVYQNYPNPFNGETIISYQLPPVTQDSFGGNGRHVTLRVYNLQGQLVATLVDKDQERGQYVVYWNGRDTRGQEVASGVYFYTLQARGFIKTKKMAVIR